MITIDNNIKKLKNEVIDIRRHLHRTPEPGLLEHETTRFIIDYLINLGIQCEIAATGTGVIGFVKGSRGDKTVAFRADIDALSVEEQTEVSYKSERKGYMHACGHDGHTSILLGFAKFLSQLGNKLENNVVLIFQPAEEGPGGAETIVNSGILDKYKVDCIFGLHIFPDIPEGKIGCRPGAMMAQTGEFDIRIIGRDCHGAMPHKGNDAMVAAASMVLSLNTIVSRNVDPLEPAVVTVGRMQSGERRNIIAGDAVLEGTMRAFNDATYNRIRGRVINIMNSVAEAYECKTEYEIRDMYPAVNNDEGLFKKLTQAVDENDLILLSPQTISEDYSYYQKKIPGLFVMLGSRNENLGFVYPLHSNKFNFNEEILLSGIQLFYNLLNECR
ncbi:MAG: M20 metallopeptidase family protein [Caulobacteraceae bacterium]